MAHLVGCFKFGYIHSASILFTEVENEIRFLSVDIDKNIWSIL